MNFQARTTPKKNPAVVGVFARCTARSLVGCQLLTTTDNSFEPSNHFPPQPDFGPPILSPPTSLSFSVSHTASQPANNSCVARHHNPQPPMSNPPYMVQQQSPLWFPELQADFLESEATFGTSQRTWGQQDSSACFYGRGAPALVPGASSHPGVSSLGGYYSEAHSHLRGTPYSYYHRQQGSSSDPSTTDGLEGELARLSLTRAGSRDSSLGGSSTGTWASEWSGFNSCNSAVTTPGGGPVGTPSPQHRRSRHPSRHASHHNKAMDSSDAAHILQCLFHEENGVNDWQR